VGFLPAVARPAGRTAGTAASGYGGQVYGSPPPPPARPARPAAKLTEWPPALLTGVGTAIRAGSPALA